LSLGLAGPLPPLRRSHFRNVTAHEPEIEWAIGDALDILTVCTI